MEIVDESGLQILADRGDAATDADILTSGDLTSEPKGRLDATRHEVELSATCHLERCTRMMRQHEDRRVIRRLIAPPPSPAFIGPRTANGSEHVPSENPCADSPEPQFGHLVVDAGFAIAQVVHAAPHACVEEPIHQLGAPDAK